MATVTKREEVVEGGGRGRGGTSCNNPTLRALAIQLKQEVAKETLF